MSNQRVNRTFDQLEVGDIIFCRTTIDVDAIRYLKLSGSSRQIRQRTHPMVIVHKDTSARVITGVQMTSKPLSSIDSDKRKYFEQSSAYVGGHSGVMLKAGFNRVQGGGTPAPIVCCLPSSSLDTTHSCCLTDSSCLIFFWKFPSIKASEWQVDVNALPTLGQEVADNERNQVVASLAAAERKRFAQEKAAKEQQQGSGSGSGKKGGKKWEIKIRSTPEENKHCYNSYM